MTVLAFLPTQTTYVEPMPIQETATTTEEAIVEEEIKDPEETYPGIKCNCYEKVRSMVPNLPRMADIYPNAEPVAGAVAVEWFGEIKHVSVVTEVTDIGVWVKESNYHHCQESERFIHFTKPSLFGFWVAG